MRILIIFIALCTLLQISSADEAALIEQGRTLSAQVFSVLGSNLVQALQAGGPTNAIPFCSLVAAPITRSLSEAHGADIRRITHKPRNPANRADEAEMKLIERYRVQLADEGGAKPCLRRDANGVPVYYAPIAIGKPLCLQCHGIPGEDVLPSTIEAIRARYPEDEATGFRMGDLRGLWRIAFTNMPPASP